MTQRIDVHSLSQRLEEPDVRIFDVRFSLDQPAQGRSEFAAAHIPGARYLHLDEDLSAPVIPGETGRHPLPEPEQMQALLRRAGVNQHTQVIVYDDGPGLFASRLWWMLRWLDHGRVGILDGGFKAWQEAGLPVTQETPRPVAEGNFVARADNGKLIDADEIHRRLDDPSLQLLDARGPARFTGEAEPIDPVAGHIPGAANLPCAANVNDNGNWLDNEQLGKRFEPWTKGDAELVAYCGSGVTACHTILAAVEAGLPEPRLYAGSWSHWITDPGRPVATGE
ncbi:sulfurtransferase [Halopseudomonas salina]|uniref:3-mercaptopyruvate sulfurtransferase n=1 Tax=Halopseudomonas salina TaxID=1323744 RepID=A0ABQ1PHK5_9GAMM|nr:sulfurtransferase [Halopseudomonas salina]GGC96969.1 putative 3-mercaptopyruvate sulfurtransferase [Halopseudomonas salina]